MAELSHAGTVAESPPAKLESKRERRLRHDLRQSVCAVMALAEIVERGELGHHSLERLDQIRREAEWMAKLITNGGSAPGQVRVVDIGEAVTESWAMVAACSPCVVRLVREPRAYALVDPMDLRRSVRNLIENAVRAVGPGGCVEVRVLTRGHEVVFEVADTGPGFGGLPPQQGLGLQTVRRFVTRSGALFFIGTSELGGALVGFRLASADVDEDPAGGASV